MMPKGTSSSRPPDSEEPFDYEEHKRNEKNKRRREAYARKKESLPFNQRDISLDPTEEHQRNERNKRRREAYARKKESLSLLNQRDISLDSTVFEAPSISSVDEGMYIAQQEIQSVDSTAVYEIDPVKEHQRNERNRKRREAYARKKASLSLNHNHISLGSTVIELTPTSTVHEGTDIGQEEVQSVNSSVYEIG